MRRWGIRTVSLFVVLDFASVMNSNSAVCVCVDVVANYMRHVNYFDDEFESMQPKYT